jgi:hypothetical protein
MAHMDHADHRRGLERASRRLLLRGTLSIGALSLLTGCNLEDDDAVDRVLSAMSRWNDTRGIAFGICLTMVVRGLPGSGRIDSTPSG